MLIAAWLHTCSHAFGQVYFDSLYDSGVFSNSLEGIWGKVATNEAGYTFVSLSRDGSQTEARLWAVKTDLEGGRILQAVIGDPNQMYRVADMVKTPTGFTVLSRYAEFSPMLMNQYRLTILNEELSVVAEFTYGDLIASELPFHLQSCSDGGYLLVGQYNNSTNTDGDMQAIRVADDGSLLWDKKYGGPEFESCNSAIQTPDSGFLLLGWTRSYGAGQRDFYLVKTDSLGNQEWQRTYGGGEDEIGADIIVLSNGNYLLTGGGDNNISTAWGYLYEVTPTGQLVWHRKYASGTAPKDFFYKSLQLADGSIVSCGLAENSGTGGNAGWLHKVTPTGEIIIWNRVYDKNQYTDLFYSVLATDDGGFLLSGQARNEETLSQDAWLLKVDSVGCPYPNCLVGIEAPLPPEGGIWAWPNPVSEVVNVQWHTGKNAIVTFTDMLGRSYSPPAQEVQGVVGPYMSFDVSTFENGLYLLTIVQNSVRTTLKVVVQH